MITPTQLFALIAAIWLLFVAVVILYSPATPGQRTVGALTLSVLAASIIFGSLAEAIRRDRQGVTS
jgi:hypothetical protein